MLVEIWENFDLFMNRASHPNMFAKDIGCNTFSETLGQVVALLDLLPVPVALVIEVVNVELKLAHDVKPRLELHVRDVLRVHVVSWPVPQKFPCRLS